MSVKTPLGILWFRRDLRLKDNPALFEAARRGSVLPVYIDDGGEAGGAARWWLHHSLEALRRNLEAKGLPLILRRGEALEVLTAVARESGADAVYWNRLYEPATLLRDQAVKTALKQAGLEAHSFQGALLREPWDLQTLQGKPYQVFTPFYRNLLTKGPARPALAVPSQWRGPAKVPQGETPRSLVPLPKQGWDKLFYGNWQPGEEGARQKLKRFLESAADNYVTERDRPSNDGGTSRLSPHLHFGELSPFQIWDAAAGQTAFLRELAWREFSHHLLYHFPKSQSEPLRPAFKAFPWKRHAPLLRAWQEGRTGYPIVDAGMRQLWRTGFMHNRVRMIAASFLVKDLLVDWRHGAAWFMDTLVDADLAQNTLGWQWTAGCGADAAPFFRIFNPVVQGKRFDPEGEYVRRWVPELAQVPAKNIHAPWEAALKIKGYPAPLVDHAQARDRALELFKALPRA